MKNVIDFYKFYEPYISFRNIFDINTIVENYINENYSKIVEKQFKQYKNEGKYRRAAEFIETEIKSGLKNPDSYYLELKKGSKKNITDILPSIKKLPIIENYIDNLEYAYEQDRRNLKECLKLGKTLMDFPEYSHYLLWIFSTTDDNSKIFQYGSSYLNKISEKIKDNMDQFANKSGEDYNISLICFQKYFNIDIFLTKESILDSYIQSKYPDILKDQYEESKKNFLEKKKPYSQEEFIKTMVRKYTGDGKSLFHALIKRNKKLDNDLLKKFREFPILKDANYKHSKRIEKLNYIRLALQMGALAFNKFPHLTSDIINAINKGKGNFEELANSFAFIAYQMYKEEQFIESQIKERKYYRTNSEEHTTARLLGFNL